MSRVLACLGVLVASAALAADPAVHREVLPGGLELVVIPVRGAATSSLRYVVRAGSMADPGGRAGLAHLLEHVLIRGAAGSPSLVEASRGAGATLNAFTTRQTTTFVLDAPSGAFPALADRYLRAVTSPAFLPAEVDKELDVVGREGDHAGGGTWSYAEEVVYRSQPLLGSTLGQPATRTRISRKDLLEFFQRHYATANTTIILSGAVTPETARQLVDRAVLLPPSLPGEYLPPSPASPSLPATEKLRAPFIAAMFGYALAPEDNATCQSLADIIELRMFVKLHVREPLLRSIAVGCVNLRGTQFLLAIGQAPTLEVTDLPEVIDKIFREAGTVPPLDRERGLLEKRFGRERDKALGDPVALADSAADSAANTSPPAATVVPLLAPHRASPEALRAAVRRSFVPERRVLIQLSPFEG